MDQFQNLLCLGTISLFFLALSPLTLDIIIDEFLTFFIALNIYWVMNKQVGIPTSSSISTFKVGTENQVWPLYQVRQYVKMALVQNARSKYDSILIDFENDFEIWMPLHRIRVDATSDHLQGVEWIFSYVRNESGSWLGKYRTLCNLGLCHFPTYSSTLVHLFR